MRTRNRKKSLPIRKAKKKQSPSLVPLAQDEDTVAETQAAILKSMETLHSKFEAAEVEIGVLKSRIKELEEKIEEVEGSKICTLIPSEPPAKNNFGRFVPKTAGNYRFFCPYVSN